MVLRLQGMGEGEGKKDVSDQIQDEDQLLGAQQKDQPPPESKVHHAPSEHPQQPSRPATTSTYALQSSYERCDTHSCSPAYSLQHLEELQRGNAFQPCNDELKPGWDIKARVPIQEDKEEPQKGEEEAKGVEMEGDFEGDLFDLPSDAENDDEEGEQDEDNEERLDQEMGDVGQEGQVGFAWAAVTLWILTLLRDDAAVMISLTAEMA